MKHLKILLERFFIGSFTAALASILGLWLAVIWGTEISWKQSFQDTALLARTVSGVTVELLQGAPPEQESNYVLDPEKIREITLVLLKDSGVSGIFSNGDMLKFTKPKDLRHLAQEFNRFLEDDTVQGNEFLKEGMSFYLILVDQKGRRSSYEYIGGELTFNSGTLAHRIRSGQQLVELAE